MTGTNLHYPMESCMLDLQTKQSVYLSLLADGVQAAPDEVNQQPAQRQTGVFPLGAPRNRLLLPPSVPGGVWQRNVGP